LSVSFYFSFVATSYIAISVPTLKGVSVINFLQIIFTEAGAFTGASKSGKPGKIESADGGTLFLDEVGELPLDMQVKLLRALQEQEIIRIGGNKPKKVNVRIISATNRDLEKMVSAGDFRADLYYRLNVFSIHIPPLRERVDDIPYLIYDFLHEFSDKYDKLTLTISIDAIHYLTKYHWPGNIRELRNVLEMLVVLEEQNIITEKSLYRVLPKEKVSLIPANKNAITLNEEREQLEKLRIIETLQTTYGNKSSAAKILGISRANLYKKLKKHGIEMDGR
jgi:sigma-54 dependent transcriptional regulator, acetoin dehydrogenase operon transcriptional activator AcoR